MHLGTLCIHASSHPQTVDLNRTDRVITLTNLHLHARLHIKLIYIYNKLPQDVLFS
jgi:hypothetical protein